jgi:hypothetical protein
VPPVVWPYLLGRFADRHHRTVLDTHNLALRPKQYPPLVIGRLGPKVEQLGCSSDSRSVELALSVRYRTRSPGAEPFAARVDVVGQYRPRMRARRSARGRLKAPVGDGCTDRRTERRRV